MALSTVAICNLALSHLSSQSHIESIDENSKEAKLAKRWYDEARIETLEAFDWGFARVEKDLTAHSEDPPFDWGYRYQYPTGCVRFRGIVNPNGLTDDPVPFKMYLNGGRTQKTICTNVGDTAKGWFTADISQPDLFSRHFAHTLSRRLAMYMAYDITGDKDAEKLQTQHYIAMLLTAASSEANEQQDAPPREAEHIRGR